MIVHATMKRKKEAARCPALAGQTFEVFDGLSEPVRSGTVKIENDLSYTADIGGVEQSGQLTEVTPRREYKYHENGPPVVDGTLTCVGGRWFFQDSSPGADASGSIALPAQ